MTLIKDLRASLLSIVLIGLVIPGALALTVSAQTSEGVALQRGYRTGYSDGYMAGYRDSIDSRMQSYTRHPEYAKAERAYNPEYGSRENYRDGYQQGFETGYITGYERRSFESALPTGLKKRGVVAAATQQPEPATIPRQQPEPVAIASQQPEPPVTVAAYTTVAASTPDTTDAITTQDSEPADTYADPIDQPAIQTSTSTAEFQDGPIIIIPRETELILELQDDLSTELSTEGQRFTAKIISPSEIAGATVEGRVAKILKPGKIKRRSELLLSFDRIVLTDNRWSNFSGTLVEVMAIKGDNVKSVDVEGTAIGQSSMRTDAIKVGGATGAGLFVGAIVGGPVGAAVGAGMGAAFGVGAVVIDRGKQIRLNRNQQVRIRTSYETQIR
jgi:hypothetical protein